MAFRSRELFQRRRVVTTPSFVARKTASGSCGKRNRRVHIPDPDRAALIAAVALTAISIPLGYLINHFLGKGAKSFARNGDDASKEDRLVKGWKPRPVKGPGAAETALKRVTSGRHGKSGNNDKQTNSIRGSKFKAKKADQENHHSFYRPKFDESDLGYDVNNCPPSPLDYYPKAWKATQVLRNWNPNDATTSPTAHREIYQGLCIFDYQTQYDIARAYRDAEKPFIVRNDLNVMSASKRWSDPDYLLEHLPDEKVFTERSPVNHFMFYQAKRRRYVKHWVKPANDAVEMNYREWLEHALEREGQVLSKPEVSARVKEMREERISKEMHEELGARPPNDDEVVEDEDTEEEKRVKWYYLFINGWLEDANNGTDKFVFDELPFFDPRKKHASDLYLVEPELQRGVNCRFGMRGIIAENHFDLSRNTIALLEGRRRYLIGHPSQCKHMALYPNEHPSGRHSSFDWSNIAEWDVHPEFKDAHVSEIVMHAGDVLYLPTSWFHYIVNLSKNIQCNIRSGTGSENSHFMNECGFNPKAYSV